MRKQSSERKRGSAKLANANKRISQSASHAVQTLASRVDGSGLFSVDYLKESYLSKFNDESVIPAATRRTNAIKKWHECEKKNSITNATLRGRDRGYNILPRVTWYAFLEFAQNLTSKILGPLEDDLLYGSFSGGASTSRKRVESHPALKFSEQADVTSECMEYVDALHKRVHIFREYGLFRNLTVVSGAKLFTVPKKTDIDRCACKEPDINMFLQKGVGKHVRRRLLRFGVNLNDQSINRKLAHDGSVLGHLATLDLSSASDSVTISCVEALLPRDWFLYLNDIRSRFVEVDGVNYRTGMFSSMGNGFTFELESLIFYVLMRATAYFRGIRGIVSVYGDDIIIPCEMYDDALWILAEFGFSPNPEKSFSDGPFRESCGGHYHNGEDVTPFYLKRKAVRLTDVIRIANQFRRFCLTTDFRQYELPAMYNIWLELANFVPRDLWGGCDLASDTQLVAPVPPKNKLVRSSKDKKVPDVGSYAHWHNSNWARTGDPEDGFQPVDTEVTFCLKRRAYRTPITSVRFREEWGVEFGPA